MSQTAQHLSPTNPLRDLLKAHGYSEIREVGELGLCGLQRFIFTVGVCYGLDECGYAGRICFDTWANAALFLEEWDGATLPNVGDDGCTAIK